MTSTTASKDETIEKLNTRIFNATLLAAVFLSWIIATACSIEEFHILDLSQRVSWLGWLSGALVVATSWLFVGQAAKLVSLIFQRALLAHDLHKD